jgi:DNA topoisomerase IB-like protein
MASDGVAAAQLAGLRYRSDEHPGIRRVKKGRRFTYVDRAGHPVRDAADLRRIRRRAIRPAWMDVWISQARRVTSRPPVATRQDASSTATTNGGEKWAMKRSTPAVRLRQSAAEDPCARRRGPLAPGNPTRARRCHRRALARRDARIRGREPVPSRDLRRGAQRERLSDLGRDDPCGDRARPARPSAE